MLADEILRSQARAAIQAQERDARYEARSFSQSISTDTLPHLKLQVPPSPTITMEEPQYAKIIDSIPVFSGEPKENINDWLEIVSLKFDIIGYESRQKRRFIPQYLAGTALKWHLTHRDDLLSWDDYTKAITAAFPRLSTTSRDMNLQMLKDRKQGATESFTEYYTSILDLCHKHDQDMTDLHIIDWLKAGMNLNLYEKLQGEEFSTPQALLIRAQRLELDNAVIAARKREGARPTPVLPTTPSSYYNTSKRWNQSAYYPPPPSSTYIPSYPTPLMSAPYIPSVVPSYTTAPNFRPMFTPQFSPNPYSSFPITNSSTPPRPPIVCYTCGQPGHISPNCTSSTTNPSTSPRRTIVCYSCGAPGHISPHCPSHPKV